MSVCVLCGWRAQARATTARSVPTALASPAASLAITFAIAPTPRCAGRPAGPSPAACHIASVCVCLQRRDDREGRGGYRDAPPPVRDDRRDEPPPRYRSRSRSPIRSPIRRSRSRDRWAPAPASAAPARYPPAADTGRYAGGAERSRFEEKRCYQCDQSGHIKRDCPQLAGGGRVAPPPDTRLPERAPLDRERDVRDVPRDRDVRERDVRDVRERDRELPPVDTADPRLLELLSALIQSGGLASLVGGGGGGGAAYDDRGRDRYPPRDAGRDRYPDRDRDRTYPDRERDRYPDRR